MYSLNLTLEIIKLTLPSVVVFLTAYYLLRMYSRNEQIKKSLDNKSLVQKDVVILRLQAYERLVLFLERISPSNLVMRLDMENLSADQFQIQLLTVIRAEFEHNLAQQLYVSGETWQIVVNAKEEIIKTINISKERMTGEKTAFNLSRAILTDMLDKQSPTALAILIIKKEASSLF